VDAGHFWCENLRHVEGMEMQMTTYAWKFTAIALLLVGTAACRSNHGNNVAAAENVKSSVDAAPATHTADKPATARQ
jgi:hypothetical protein